MGLIKKKVFENDKQEVEKKQREYFVDQYESIIFELIRYSDKKIIDGLKVKYPSLEKFILALNVQVTDKKENQNGARPLVSELNNDLDSNIHSHEEDIGNFSGADKLDSNPDDS